MRKNLVIIALALFSIASLSFSFVRVAEALSTYQTIQGGTGTTTPSGILYGDNGSTSHLNTVTIGSNLTFSGGVLSATASAGINDPFTHPAYGGSATTSIMTLSGGLLSTASSTFTADVFLPTATSSTVLTTDASGLIVGTTTIGIPWGGTNNNSWTVSTPVFVNAQGDRLVSGSVTSPITITGLSLGCQTASGSQAGCLSSADWTTFNNKQTPGFQISTSSIGISQLAYFSGTSPTTLTGVATSSTGTASAIVALTSLQQATIPYASSTALTVSGTTYLSTAKVSTALVGNDSSGGLYQQSGNNSDSFYINNSSIQFSQPSGWFVFNTTSNQSNPFGSGEILDTSGTTLATSTFPNLSGTFLIGSTTTAAGYLGVATTTPNWPLTISKSNGPQLSLTDTTANDWTLRSAGGNLYFATSTYTATSSATALTINTNGYLGLASSTPNNLLSVSNLFSINSSGEIMVTESQPATSTALVLDWRNSAPQIDYRIGASATTITLINATNTEQAASRKLVEVCNPNQTAGALTWAGVEWIGTAPTQTTTANQCDFYSFTVTLATSTSAYKVAGTAGTGFQ